MVETGDTPNTHIFHKATWRGGGGTTWHDGKYSCLKAWTLVQARPPNQKDNLEFRPLPSWTLNLQSLLLWSPGLRVETRVRRGRLVEVLSQILSSFTDVAILFTMAVWRLKKAVHPMFIAV